MENRLPFVTAALICENVIEEKTGSLTVVRIADRIDYEVEGMPQGMKPAISLKGLLSLKSGSLKGDFTVRIQAVRPSGEKRGDPIVVPVKLLGGDHGVNTILNITLGVEEEGLHWFDVYFENDLISRIPLMLVQRQRQPELK